MSKPIKIEWIVYEELGQDRIDNFDRKFEMLKANAWHHKCDASQIERAKVGGAELHDHKIVRETQNCEQGEKRDEQEGGGKGSEEGLLSLTRKVFPFLVIPDIDYQKYKLGDKRTRYTSDVGSLFNKTHIESGVKVGVLLDGKQYVDKFGRIGPSFLIGPEFYDSYQVEVEKGVFELRYTLEDDRVCVIGHTTEEEYDCSYYGWCTYKDLRYLFFNKLMTPMYNGKKHKVGFFLFDLIEHDMVRSMDDLEASQVIRPDFVYPAKVIVVEQSPMWHVE